MITIDVIKARIEDKLIYIDTIDCNKDDYKGDYYFIVCVKGKRRKTVHPFHLRGDDMEHLDFVLDALGTIYSIEECQYFKEGE